MPDVRTFQVSAPTTERLDRFLADQLSLSRTQAARLVGEGAVTVNHQPGRAGRSLTRGDLVSVRFPEAAPPRVLTPHPIALQVVFEDEWLLVIDKPAGLVVHPAPGHWDDTLVNALVARGTALSDGAAGRPGIVHRLDRDTSGLMVVAKTETAHRRLASALYHRKVERVYAALVWGHVDGGPRVVDAPVARHPADRKRMTVLPGGRPARTRVEQVARFDVCDLVRLTLDTGRTHQIRVHMAHIGHPVVGDPVYGGGGAKRVAPGQRRAATALEQATPRQALHAAILRFPHPSTRELLEFGAPWPPDLERALALAGGPEGAVTGASVLRHLGLGQHDG